MAQSELLDELVGERERAMQQVFAESLVRPSAYSHLGLETELLGLLLPAIPDQLHRLLLGSHFDPVGW